MGKIFEHFNSLKDKIEADVEQNFVMPLLTQYLGYSLADIKPKQYFSTKHIFVGHKEVDLEGFPEGLRPDFVVCINDIPKFIIETKKPDENLDKHLPQMKSYLLTDVNFLVITNGNRLRIYDANEILFEAESIEELDVKFDLVRTLLSKEAHSSFSPIELVQSIDLIKSLGKTEQQIIEEEKRKRLLKISDFRKYLETVEQEFQDWQIPREFQSLPDFPVEQYPPDRLHRFQIYEISKFTRRDEEKYILPEVEQNFGTPVKIFIGPSGIGKTTLLKYMTYIQASACLSLHSEEIPVFISLRNFGYNTGLKNLIIDSLERRGFNVSLERLSELLQKHTFIFLLDAFDEIQEKYLEDAKRELEVFVSRGNHKYIITSRKSRSINLPQCSQFYVNELEESETEHFLEQYLGSRRYEFLSEIKRNGLIDESKNTLMLTLMIFLYKKIQRIPLSETKIIGAIVRNIKHWEQSKGERLAKALRWEIKEKIFSEFAYKIFETQGNLSLSKECANSVLLPLLESLEENKEIPRGIDKHRIIDDLTLTGIISRDFSDKLSFWHRAFLNYFASKVLAEKYHETPEVLNKIKEQVTWKPVLISSTGHLNDSTKFVENVRDTNLFLASACAIEAKKISEQTIKDIVSSLTTKCSSPIPEIRRRAIKLLQRFQLKYTREALFDLLKHNQYPYIRAVALEEIAKEKSKEAKETVYKLIDWYEVFTFGDGDTRESIVKALSNFDVEEQLKIIEIWRREPDIFTDYACREAIRSIIIEGRLAEKAKNAIIDFYIEKENINYKWTKEHGLAELLIEINDENLVPILLESLVTQDIQNAEQHRTTTEGILANYKSPDVIEDLFSKVVNIKNEDIVREVCAGALSKSKGKVSLSIFESLLEDNNPKVRRSAIKGLNRFSSAEIKDFLQKHLNDKNWGVQYETIEILGDKGLLVEFFEENIFPPKSFYRFNIGIFLKQIQKYKLHEMLPILNWLKGQIDGKDDRLLINVAHTYYVIGEKKQSKKIIESFFHENGFVISQYGLGDLSEIASVFDSSYALEVIRKVFKFIDKFEDFRVYLEEKCIESLERIGTQEAFDFLKNLAEKYTVQKHVMNVERTLRSANRIATKGDEDWYIDFIKSNPHLNRSDICRVLEGLGRIGSEKSLPIIKEIAKLRQEDEYILNTCFLSLESIYTSQGMLIEITEETLLKGGEVVVK